MSAKYTRLPMTDRDEQYPSTQYGSAFTYEAPHAKGNKLFKSMYKWNDREGGNSRMLDVEYTKPSLIFRCFTGIVTLLCYLGLLLTLPVSGWFCIKTIKQHERFVVFRIGHLQATKATGLIIVLPCIDRLVKVDLRIKAFSVPPQKILTSDNAAIEGGADIVYRITDAIKCVNSVQEVDGSVRVLSQTALQRHLTKQTLNDIETNKIMLGHIIQEDINKGTREWGLEVSRVEISQIKVIQGPTEGNAGQQAQNLLNMVAPALVPAGMNTMPGPANSAQMSGGQAFFSQALAAAAPGLQTGFQTGFQTGGQTDAFAGSRAPGAKVTFDSPRELIAVIQGHLGPELVQQFGFVYKFIVCGNGGGTFFLDLKNGSGSAGEGEPMATPDATLTLSILDMMRIMKGDLNTFSAYMTGQLTIDGDVQAVVQLGTLVEKLK